MTWPWTNLTKELEKRSKELDANKHEVKSYTVETLQDMLDEIRNRKQTVFERVWNYIRFTSHDVVWAVYRFFKPSHKRIRKAIPRQWCDLTELVLLVNFEIIKSFVEEEMETVDWSSNEEYKDAAAWLKSSYEYITKGRDELQSNLKEAYNNIDYKSSSPYYEKYKTVIEIEAKIEQADKQTLIGLANYRGYLWT